MNVYDFDKTIYDGDSSVDFYRYCVLRYPQIIRKAPRQAAAVVCYGLGRITKTQMKQALFAYMALLPDTLRAAEDFWSTHRERIKTWYIVQKREDDVIISASPRFLLSFVCPNLIASEVNPKDGTYCGINCRGEEKVRRFRELYADAKIENFYSDSFADTPLAIVSEKAFLVKGDKIIPWPEAELKNALHARNSDREV
ncbi:MAG: haloacid dehalogenase-like hydrolase [Clostridia bacterium]|nr:haloacid dehalogenase-like hydrolase [Clostridia bacterium]